MAGRPKKAVGEKLDARVPFMALKSEQQDYEWARSLTDHKFVSEWVRATLNAEVARLRRKHGKPE